MKLDSLLNPLQPSNKRTRPISDYGGETKRLCTQPDDAISGIEAFATDRGLLRGHDPMVDLGFAPRSESDQTVTVHGKMVMAQPFRTTDLRLRRSRLI